MCFFFLKAVSWGERKEDYIDRWMLIHGLITSRMVLIQLDIGSFIMSSMPGGSVERLVNTVHPKTQKNPRNLHWNQRPEPARLKRTGSLLSVSTKGLCQKSPPPRVFFITVFSFGKSSTSVWASIWNSNLWILQPMAQTTLTSSSSIVGAFPLVWQVPQQDLPTQGERNPTA